MSSVSRDLLILQVLTAHLQGVTTGNGYEFDLADSVFRGRTRFSDNDQLPMLSIIEAPRTEDPLNSVGDLDQIRGERWNLLVQGWAVDDKENPTDPVYLLKASVEDRLSRLTLRNPETGNPVYPDEYLLGQRVQNLQIGPGIVSPPRENISSKAFFYLPVSVERVYDPADALVTT